MKKVLLVTLFSAALTAAVSISPRAASAGDFAKLVECFSDANCASLNLGTLCGNGNTAVSISCTNIAFGPNPTNCGGGTGAQCSVVFSGSGAISLNNTSVGTFCRDGSGFDAIVWCHTPF